MRRRDETVYPIKPIDFQVGPTASAMNAEGLQDRMIRAGLDPVEVDIQLGDYYDWLVEQGATPESIQRDLLDQLDGVIRNQEAQNLLRSKMSALDGIPF